MESGGQPWPGLFLWSPAFLKDICSPDSGNWLNGQRSAWENFLHMKHVFFKWTQDSHHQFERKESRKNTKTRVFKHKNKVYLKPLTVVTQTWSQLKASKIVRVLYWQRNHKPDQQSLV